MEVWKSATCKQQQPQPQQPQQVSHLSQKVQEPKTGKKSGGEEKKEQVKHTTTSDSIRAIANVLNQHHNNSKLLQQATEKAKKKALVYEETGAKNNKLDQPVESKGHIQSHSQSNKCSLRPLVQKGADNKSSASHDITCGGAATCSTVVGEAKECVYPLRRQSPSCNQVDLSNSYLYAYNDFVTLHGQHTCTRLVEPVSKHQHSASSLVVVDSATSDKGVHEEHLFCSTHQQEEEQQQQKRYHNQEEEQEEEDEHHFQPHHLYHHHHHHTHHLEESLIDSEEDDALSYILHQHKLNSNHRQDFNNCSVTNQADFQLHQIDHHLSCARKSHPRHICGIGSSSPAEKQLQEGRKLKERAKANRKLFQSNAGAAKTQDSALAFFESHKFTQDLTVLHNQLVHQQPHLHSQKHNLNQASAELLQANQKQQHLELPQPPPIKPEGQRGQVNRLKAQLEGHESSGSCESVSESARLTQERALVSAAANKAHQIHHQPGYLNWFLCRFTNFLPGASASAATDTSYTGTAQQRPAYELSGNSTVRHQYTTRNLQQRQQQQVATSRQVNLNEQLAMYSASSQAAAGAPPPPAVTYYTGQPADVPCPNYTRHHHHYPISSESSLDSSGPFASSALRVNALFRSLCSKKCLFVTCLALILLIFIAVISLSAYLNFLINLNRISLMPLSGRLKVDTRGDMFIEQLNNRSSPEYLDKQQQYETILRGAFDRTEWALKSYPNHLVKCEVYSFRPGSLWVYFRLFINKRTLLLDQQLMRRRAYDEQLDQQFLPLLTQQTLHSGLRQLMQSGNSAPVTTSSSPLERRSRASQVQQPDSTARQTGRPPEAINSLSKRSAAQVVPARSFDDQITRLMPIITAIELQSIEVSPEFDILRAKTSSANLALQSPLAPLGDSAITGSPFITSSPSSPASSESTSEAVGSSRITEYEVGLGKLDLPLVPPLTANMSVVLARAAAKQQAASANGVTRVFTLFPGYRENITRPTTSAKPSTSTSSSTAYTDKVSTGDGWRGSSESAVVKLESGQPVLSQNPRSTGVPVAKNITSLFGPFLKLDKSTLIEQANNNNGTSTEKQRLLANATGSSQQQQMVAPYQQNNFFQLPPLISPASNHGSPTTNGSTFVALELPSSHDVSIQELWNNTIANKRNLTSRPDQQQSSQAKRLITITEVDAKNLHDTMAPSNIDNRQKAGPSIPYELSTSTLPPPITFSTPFVVSAPAPARVSPHLKQGGSIISMTGQRHSQPLETTPFSPSSTSAVLLSKDLPFQPIGQAGEPQLVGAASTNSSQQVAKPQAPSAGHGEALAPLAATGTGEKPRRKLANVAAIGIQAKPISLLTQANSNDSNSRQFSMKEGKIKKIAEQILLATTVTSNGQLQTKNNNDTAGSVIKSKGIRIVDNYLASLSAANRSASGAPPVDIGDSSLPSGIELTRSVTGATRVVENHSNRGAVIGGFTSGGGGGSGADGQSPVPATQPLADYTTTSLTIANNRFTSPATISITENLVRLTAPVNSFPTPVSSASLPNIRSNTATSGSSNQWKPIPGTSTVSAALLDELLAANNRTTTNRKPSSSSSSLIVGNEKLVQTINVPSTNQGSQSPFAMPAAGLLLDTHQPQRVASANRLRPLIEQMLPRGRPLTHKITTSTYRANPNHPIAANEFESHRMSRMRQQNDHLFTSSEAVSAPTLMKAIEAQLDSGNASSQLPSVLLNSGLQQAVRKTRGPFAFESLKSMDGHFSTDKPSFMDRVFPARSQLTRKELTFDNADDNDDVINSSSTINPTVTTDEPDAVLVRTNITELSDTNNKKESDITIGNYTQSLLSQDDFGSRRLGKKIKRLIRRQQKVNNSSDSFRCQYYGCQAKGGEKFICLNYTQICDDFIDCQDESDELDCVSLLKHDSQTNRLSFSNGAGIIYLNRRGSLAPLCIDYYQSSAATSSNPPPSELPGNSFESLQWNSSKRQQELIRQINTIGQYACKLQSFSRLVSVKINHNSLVDGLDLIKKSKLYHRLSIVEVADGEEEPIISFATSGSQASPGNMKHGVEVSTSSHCPSQRTAFVKCGGFECGQDSLSMVDKAAPSKARDGLVINDFPWLVKLYWRGSLSCHGYLIDDLWLISSSQCLGNKSGGIHNVRDWTAEISHEHYGLDDYQSIESNRRNIKSILLQPQQDNADPSFVLVKLENSVRFSPLNRPICLPMGSAIATNKTAEFLKNNKECVTVTLPGADSQQDLVLKKVKFLNPRDCHRNDARSSKTDASVCVSELGSTSGSNNSPTPADSTRVLVCSTTQTTRNRSKWTLVGVQSNQRTKDSNKLLFSTVSNQINWIVDTMNPKSHLNSITPGTRDSKLQLPLGAELLIQQSPNNNSTQQVCNNFKCSTGECLSWSRICDGLYDCSSHEDEKDCHK